MPTHEPCARKTRRPQLPQASARFGSAVLSESLVCLRKLALDPLCSDCNSFPLSLGLVIRLFHKDAGLTVSALPQSARSHSMRISSCQYALRNLVAPTLAMKHQRKCSEIARGEGGLDLRSPDAASVFMRRLRVLGGEGGTQLADAGLRFLYWCVRSSRERVVFRCLNLTEHIGLCMNII